MLNVFIAIIPLLLLSAAFVQVAVIQTGLPSGAPAAAAAAQTTEPLDLAIYIRPQGYILTSNGHVLRAVARTTAAAPGAKSAGSPALDELTAALREIAASHAGSREVRIVAEATTRYEEIIGVMDASRAAGLPEAALSDVETEAS